MTHKEFNIVGKCNATMPWLSCTFSQKPGTARSPCPNFVGEVERANAGMPWVQETFFFKDAVIPDGWGRFNALAILEAQVTGLPRASLNSVYLLGLPKGCKEAEPGPV